MEVEGEARVFVEYMEFLGFMNRAVGLYAYFEKITSYGVCNYVFFAFKI